jgi:hypothetical protein
MTAENREKQVNPSSEQLETILAQLTTDQMRFIVARQDVATDKAAAEQIGVSPDTISRWKREGVPIDEAVRLMAFDGLVTALHIRKRNLAKAMAVKVAGLNSDDERLRQGVATEVIEWELGRATSRQEVSGKDGGPLVVNFTSNVDDGKL